MMITILIALKQVFIENLLSTILLKEISRLNLMLNDLKQQYAVAAPSNAKAFIKKLDPNAGFSTVEYISKDVTEISKEMIGQVMN